MRKLLTILFLMITLVTQAQRQRILLTKCQTPCEISYSDYLMQKEIGLSLLKAGPM